MDKKQFISPLAWLQKLKNQFLRQELHSSDDLARILKEAEANHIVDFHTRLMIESVIQIESLAVRDVMVPKTKMVVIEHDASTLQLLEVMINSSHSRFPVLTENKDKVQGIILAKDLLAYTSSDRKKEFDYKEYLRPAVLVPESKPLGTLLRDFQQKKLHMAIVIDEYDEIAGLVTLEDVLEQIVGEIEDEHDLEEDNIIDFGEGRYLLKSATSIEEFNQFFNTVLTVDEVDTVGGFVVAGFTYVPKQMSEITLQGFNFKVLKTDSRRIHLLEVSRADQKSKK